MKPECAILLLLASNACRTESSYSMDSPRQTFTSLQRALQKRDIEGYLALQTPRVLMITSNSTWAVCKSSASNWCLRIMRQHGWQPSDVKPPWPNDKASEARKMLAALYRASQLQGGPVVFKWEDLRQAELSEVALTGTIARGILDRGTFKMELVFERGAEGWLVQFGGRPPI